MGKVVKATGAISDGGTTGFTIKVHDSVGFWSNATAQISSPELIAHLAKEFGVEPNGHNLAGTRVEITFKKK